MAERTFCFDGGSKNGTVTLFEKNSRKFSAALENITTASDKSPPATTIHGSIDFMDSELDDLIPRL